MKINFLFFLILTFSLTQVDSQTFITGHLSGDYFSWDTINSPYIISDSLVIDSDAQLGIGPGVVVMFEYNPDPLHKAALVVHGSLWAIGTGAEPVIFTSDRDDTYGDYNGDGRATIPRPGDWGFIKFFNSHGLDPNSLDNVIVKYGGGSGHDGLLPGECPMVMIEDDLFNDYEYVSINNSLIQQSLGIGIQMGRGFVFSSVISDCQHGIKITTTNCRVTNSNIHNNKGYPVILESTTIPYPADKFFEAFSGNTISDNGQDVLAMGGVMHGFTLDPVSFIQDLHWNNYNIPYLIYEPLKIQNLDIIVDPGTLIKFKAANDPGSLAYLDLPWRSSLTAHGTDQQKIVFTSEFDYQYDLAPPSEPQRKPLPGDWGFIRGSVLSFDHCYFKYGGAYVTDQLEISADSSAVLWINDNDSIAPAITNSMFRSLYKHGILAHYETLPGKPFKVEQSSFLLPYNSYGIKVKGPGQTDWGIDARNNYWNGKMGPFHADSNEVGNGCRIDGGITFKPFLTQSEDTLDLISSVIRGRVLDLEDQVVPEALVMLIGKTIKSVKSGPEGKFYIPNVRPGYGYQIKGLKYNYRDTIYENIIVPMDTVLIFDLSIEERPINCVVDTVTFKVNPDYTSGVMVGGTAIRYYKIIDIKTKNPVYGVEVFINGYPGTFKSNPQGVVAIAIPATAVGSAYSSKSYYISKIGAESATLPPELQMPFRISVLPHEYLKQWSGNTYLKLGISVIEVQQEFGASLGIDMINNGTGEFARNLRISRSSRTGAGLNLSAEAKVKFGSMEAGAEAGVGVNINALFKDQFSFVYANTTGRLALAKFTVLADGALPYMDSPLMRYFIRCLEMQNEYIKQASVGSSIGLSLRGYGSAGAGLDATLTDDDGGETPLGLGLEGSVSAAGDITFMFNHYTHSNKLDFDLSYVGEVEGELSASLGFDVTKLFGGDDDKKKDDNNGKDNGNWELDLPDIASVAASAGGRFGFNIGTTRLVPDASTRLGFMYGYKYSLGASALIWNAGLSQDRTYQYTFNLFDEQVVDIFNEKCSLAKDLFSMDPGNVKLKLGSLSGGSLFTNPFTDFVKEQVGNAFSFPPIPYDVTVTDVVDDGGFDMSLSIGFAVVKVKFGAGFKYETTNEYKRAEGVFYNFRLYPLATYNFQEDNQNYEAKSILQEILSESASYVWQQIKDYLIPPIFKRIKIWPFNRWFKSGDQFIIPVGPDTRASVLMVDSLPTADSMFVYYWDWYGTEGKSDARKNLDSKRLMISDYVRNRAKGIHKLDYGIGGFYQFEPYGRSLGNADATLTIQYFDDELTVHLPDSSVYKIPEMDLCMYKEDKENNQWVYIGGAIDTVLNTVTAAIDSLGTYTLAPYVPAGTFRFSATPDTIDLQSSNIASLVSDLIYYNTGELISNGELYTVEISSGLVLNADADNQIDGIQVGAVNGIVTINYQSEDYSGMAYIKASSIFGRSSGMHELFVRDNQAPQAPVLAEANLNDYEVHLNWNPVSDPDLTGYKVFFDVNSGAPYEGKASIVGEPSPIDAGLDTSVVISGLGKDTIYYFSITAIDRCGNESPYSNELSINTHFNHSPVIYHRVFFIEPNLPKGTVIDTLWAHDNDHDQTLSYYFAANNTCDVFALDPVTGIITVEDPDSLTYPKAYVDTFRLQVAVRDDDNQPQADSTEVLIIMQVNTGIRDIRDREELLLNLYPNPAVSHVYVSLGDLTGVREGRLQLVNVRGQILFSRNYNGISPEVQMIPLDDMPDGVYTVIFTADKKRFTGKLVIMRE